MRILLSLLIMGSISCGSRNSPEYVDGTILTTKFLNSYSGEFVDVEQGRNEELVISKDGSIKTSWSRQVGYENDKDVPYPTVCEYAQVGHIEKVYERSELARRKYQHHLPYVIEVKISRVELNPRTSSPSCKTFATRNAKGTYSYYVELINENHIRLHNSGGGDYDGKGTRTPSTLDENFFRKGSKELEAATKSKEV